MAEELRLRFKLDSERITLGDLVGMQDGNFKAGRNVLAASLVNYSGEFMEMNDALQVINALKMSQFRQTMDEFLRQIKDEAVPPLNAGL
jgi:hypothetical protein